MGHKVQISFTPEQWKLIEQFRGPLGQTDADLVRNIIIAWLAEKSVISTLVKEKMHRTGGD